MRNDNLSRCIHIDIRAISISWENPHSSAFIAGIPLFSGLPLLGGGSMVADPVESRFAPPLYSFGDRFAGEKDHNSGVSAPDVHSEDYKLKESFDPGRFGLSPYTPHDGFDIYNDEEFMDHVVNET
jgi:hypothetical protein